MTGEADLATLFHMGKFETQVRVNMELWRASRKILRQRKAYGFSGNCGMLKVYIPCSAPTEHPAGVRRTIPVEPGFDEFCRMLKRIFSLHETSTQGSS